MRTSSFILLISFVFLWIAGCKTLKPYYDKSQLNWEKSTPPDTAKLKYTVFLVGDVGNPESSRQEPTLKMLQRKIYYKTDTTKLDTVNNNTSHKEDVVIFLGDNVYETGMPEPGASDRKEKERRIIEQMKVVKGFKGKTIFVPGNHDWNESRPGGLAAVNREEEFIESYLDSNDVFLPSNGCPGPVEIQFNNDLVVIALDTEWWLYKFNKPIAPDNGCTAGSRLEIIQQVQDILLRNKGKNIVFAQHHPLFSNGNHGGYYTLREYLFPLTIVRDNAYIPLPIIGAIYPLMRQYGISREDLSNKDYQQLKRGLLSVLENEKNVVIAAGHEHALQFNKYGDINHIISGAGSKATRLIKGNDALFAHGTKGITRLNYYDNGQCWVEFWEPVGDGTEGKLVYRAPLYAIPPKGASQIREEKQISYKDSTKIVYASEEYKASKFKRSLFGEHYRDSWAAPVKVSYLDLSAFAGGLTPIKMGGGHQTTSLQLQGKDKNVYQFRTVNKDPSALLAEGFLKTFAEDFFQDQVSTAHPYSGLIIPDMAKAIGIYHTNPQLVYMPYSSILGPYIQQVGGKLGTIEARPDEDVSDFKSFGNANNAVSTRKLYEELEKDNDNEVDQEMFLKSRLFDILIGDWDRHEDQWRWAEFKKKKGSLYRPIPRDRDQAFAKYDGVLPRLISIVISDLQSFEKEIKDPAKLSIAARNLDRNLLNELKRDDWIRVANEIRKELTDQVIDDAVRKMPSEVYKVSGEEIASKLKSRKQNLEKIADDYYHVLAKEVTIAGTDKKEFYRINKADGKTEVTIYKIDKDDKLDTIIYHRNFLNSETKELNLYALTGKDSIIIQGKDSGSSIKIRVIGGKGEDFIANKSDNGKVIIYDSKTGNTIDGNHNSDLRLSNKDWVHQYDPSSFHYDQKGPVPSFDYNGDDGLFLGAGYKFKHFGFRKDPYSYLQTFRGTYAPHTGAYVIKYQGDFYSLFARNLDLVFNAAFNGPKYTFNYYGQGNSTPNVDDSNIYYRVRTKNLSVSSFLQRRYTSAFRVGIGPGFEYYRVEKPGGRYVSDASFPESGDVGQPSKFRTLRTYAIIDFVNNPLMPSTGVRWRNEANYFSEIGQTRLDFLQLKTDLSFYATPNFNFPVTVAVRLGAATNIGDYKFFQANSLGNNTRLRGYRNNRFTGRSYLYQNTEARFKLANFRNYIFTGNFGAFGFFDTGRVYSDNAESSTWHSGYGPGLWMNFYNKILLSSAYGMSKEGSYISLKGGLSF